MPMTTMKDMLVQARNGGYALGAFEFWSLDSARAVIECARERNMPAILQTGPAECEFVGYKNIGLLGKIMEQNTSLSFALHMDHATEIEQIKKALDVGFTSVMIDASTKPYEENLEITCRVVELAKRYGASVESELGHVGGSESGMETLAVGDDLQTDPIQAEQFAKATGIDFLAVAIGTVHGVYRSEPNLNLDRLHEISKRVSLPLVLHGGSGTPEKKLRLAIQAGIAKINICTDFLQAMGKSYVRTQTQPNFSYSIVGLYRPAFEAGKQLVGNKMDIFSMGRFSEH